MTPVALYRYRNPLSTPLRFAGNALSHRDGLLLQFSSENGEFWGECAPLPGFSCDSLAANQQALLHWLTEPQQDISTLPMAAQFAISSARFLQRDASVLAPQPVIPLLVGTPEQMLQQASASDAAVMKLKLARASLNDEIALVQRLQQHKPQLRLRIDANRGWQPQQAQRFAEQVDINRIDYVEEPCPQLCQSLAVYQRSGLPVALDETTQHPDYGYQSLDGVVALVLKPTIIGSVSRLTDIITQAQADGLTTVLSSSFESNLGLVAIAKLAQRLTPAEPPGLDTLAPLHYDLCQPNPWLANRPLLNPQQLELLWS